MHVVLRDYNTIAVGFRFKWLDGRAARRTKSAPDVIAKMAAAETKYMERLDDEVRKGLGKDTVIINVLDGVQRPACKINSKGKPRWKERRLRCGRSREEVVAACKSEGYEPPYLVSLPSLDAEHIEIKKLIPAQNSRAESSSRRSERRIRASKCS